MNSDLRIASDLRKAANYLREHGWTQGRAGIPGDGPACLAGGILWAAEYLPSQPDCLRDYVTALGFVAPPTGYHGPDLFPGSAPDWNDQPGRTLEEVLDRLESTALGLEIKAFSETLEVAVPLESVEEGVATRV